MEYRSYLAASILSEERIITYRLLSRALKIHVNKAKQMLFEFHRQQNVKKPGTVHATYLIAGTKHKAAPTAASSGVVKDGDDVYMQSSPFRSSPAPNSEEVAEESPVLSITLVKEENLENLKSQYETVTSVHVYSLAPHPLKDLQILSDAARETSEIDANLDSLEAGGTYGTISNKTARRRTGQRHPRLIPFIGAAAHPKAFSPPSKPTDTTEANIVSIPKAEIEAKSSQSSKQIPAKGSQEKRNSVTNLPQLKRSSSNIFQSFAKAKPPVKREGTDVSESASGLESAPPSGPEDEVMKDSSEGDEDDYVLPTISSQGLSDAGRNFRTEREAALKKMMEDDDDENNESDAIIESRRPKSSTHSPASHPAEEAVRVSGSRRRGRRRVMKKKTVEDNEGYLVTREELAWESFSEDEPVKRKPKQPPPLPQSSDKSKKGLGKAGQGNIMSFFGKK